MLDWSIVVPAFFTAAVEWVEAFTIVLAVGLLNGSEEHGARRQS
jgi:uncharacterized membrane protein